MNKCAEKLADLIEKNPNAHFQIDNDCWTMLKNENSRQIITDSDKLSWETEWYAHSSNYGAGIAEALVIIAKRKGLNISAESV